LNANIADDETIVFAYLLSTTSLSEGKESGTIGIFFYRLTEFDFEALENDDIQEAAKADAIKFLNTVDKSNILTYGDVSIARGYDVFSSNMTGVGITSVFSEVQGVNHCLENYFNTKSVNC